MQPTYLSWLGYFDLIDRVDIFILLDDVQFIKQSWQQRNQIRTSKGLEWITVPVKIKGRFGQHIKDVQINPIKFPDKHLRQLTQNYSKSAFFKYYFGEFENTLKETCKSGLLYDLNVRSLKWLCSKLGIRTEFVRSSEIGVEGKRSERLVKLLKSIGVGNYVSPIGSYSYIKEEFHWFSEYGMEVSFAAYEHPEYHQVYFPFYPYVSTIDLLFNEGDASLEILRSGRREVITMESFK